MLVVNKLTYFVICARKEKEEEQKKLEEEEAAEKMRSVTSKDFNIDNFVPMEPAPTAVSSLFLLCIFSSQVSFLSFYRGVCSVSNDSCTGRSVSCQSYCLGARNSVSSVMLQQPSNVVTGRSLWTCLHLSIGLLTQAS